jgi:hypothetical protein
MNIDRAELSAAACLKEHVVAVDIAFFQVVVVAALSTWLAKLFWGWDADREDCRQNSDKSHENIEDSHLWQTCST